MLRIFGLLALLCLTQGCFSQMSVDSANQDFKTIQWRKDFAAAKADAQVLDKPILMIGGAGELSGFC